jgi:integrase
VKNGKVERKPVKVIRLQKENNCLLRWLTDEEQIRLFDVLPTEYKPRVILALHTGLRRMELFSLQWSALNFEQRLITVKESKSGETRVIPMNDTAYETLRRIPRKIYSSYVFPGKLPDLHVTDAPKSWERFLDKAGILDFKWHDLRHTFASQVVMADVDLYNVKKLLGHHDIKMTERLAHLAPGYLKDAVNLLSIPSAQVTPKVTLTEAQIS